MRSGPPGANLINQHLLESEIMHTDHQIKVSELEHENRSLTDLLNQTKIKIEQSDSGL